MITGVLAVLLGEALIFGSAAIAIWAAIFAAVNHVFFLVYEEPAVERRFGETYRRYKQNVPRWIPRRAPWRPRARCALISTEAPVAQLDRAAAF